MIENHAKLLIDVLLDKNEEIGARDDAAMNLGAYDDPEVLEALLKIATNPDKEEEFLLSACGESIAEIMVRTDQFNAKYIKEMNQIARREALAIIMVNKPKWLVKST